MDHFTRPIAAALRKEFGDDLDALKTGNAAVLAEIVQAKTAHAAGTADAANSAVADVRSLLGGRARVEFAAHEIRAQTRRFDSLEATAIGIAAAAIAALAYFLSTPDKPLAYTHTLALLLVVPFLGAMFAIGAFRVEQPEPDLLMAAEQRPVAVLRKSAETLERLYWDNERIVRRRAVAIQLSLTALVLLVLGAIGAMVYWY